MVTKVPASMMAADVATQAELEAEAAARAAAILAGNVKLTGDVVQSVVSQSAAVATGSTVLPLDDTLPQSNEGDEYLTASITPTNASSLLEIEVLLNLSNSAGAGTMIAALFRDAGASALACGAQVVANSGVLAQVSIIHRVVAGSVSPTTFRVRGGCSVAATVTLNGAIGARLFGGALVSSLTVKEIRA